MTSQGYRLLVERRARDGWDRLERDHPTEMSECKTFLRTQPTNIRASNGKAKKLKGKLNAYYQYDVTYDDRVRYEVDKETKEAKIAYAGGHP